MPLRLNFYLAAAAMTLPATACATVQEAANATTGQSIEQVATSFIDAFNSLDAARFDAFFADDVTMFFPSGPFPKERTVGKQAVTSAFHAAFDAAKQRGMTRLGIEPANLQVQSFGKLALVTFQLRGNGNIGRRSILFRQDLAGWRIVHFHASSLEAGK